MKFALFYSGLMLVVMSSRLIKRFIPESFDPWLEPVACLIGLIPPVAFVLKYFGLLS